MKVLFVSSGNKGTISPIIKNQGESLMSAGVEIDYFLIQGKGFKGYLMNVKPLRQYMKEHKYDVIHAHYSLSAFVTSLAGAKPLVVSLMGSDVKAAGWYKLIIRIFAFLFCWKAIIVKSNDMYRSLGIKRAVVIPNGVNLQRFRPMDKEECQKRLGWDRLKKHILFPANIARPEKDYALAEAAVQMTNDQLAIINTHVILHAFVNTPNEETPYWYNAADVVLMTSKWEGSPNAIKEAMACSRPIVATNVGDIAERTSGVDGCFVAQSREPKEIAALLKAAMRVPVTKGRERIIADELTNEQVAKRIVEIYQKVM